MPMAATTTYKSIKPQISYCDAKRVLAAAVLQMAVGGQDRALDNMQGLASRVLNDRPINTEDVVRIVSEEKVSPEGKGRKISVSEEDQESISLYGEGQEDDTSSVKTADTSSSSNSSPPLVLNGNQKIGCPCTNCVTKSHPPGLAKKHVCPHCNKIFTKTSHFRSHYLVHTSEKPHYCTLCEKRFKRSDQLERHLTTHNTDKRKFKCKFCKSFFSRKDNFKVHIKRMAKCRENLVEGQSIYVGCETLVTKDEVLKKRAVECKTPEKVDVRSTEEALVQAQHQLIAVPIIFDEHNNMVVDDLGPVLRSPSWTPDSRLIIATSPRLPLIEAESAPSIAPMCRIVNTFKGSRRRLDTSPTRKVLKSRKRLKLDILEDVLDQDVDVTTVNHEEVEMDVNSIKQEPCEPNEKIRITTPVKSRRPRRVRTPLPKPQLQLLENAEFTKSSHLLTSPAPPPSHSILDPSLLKLSSPCHSPRSPARRSWLTPDRRSSPDPSRLLFTPKTEPNITFISSPHLPMLSPIRSPAVPSPGRPQLFTLVYDSDLSQDESYFNDIGRRLNGQGV